MSLSFSASKYWRGKVDRATELEPKAQQVGWWNRNAESFVHDQYEVKYSVLQYRLHSMGSMVMGVVIPGPGDAGLPSAVVRCLC